ncbi:MAG: hypothetical protein NDI67_07800 [Sulfuritalea sp.]|nr:hypothetical protein [Sulfuritalea sp.]
MAHDDQGHVLSTYTIEPKLGGFAIHGALPIALLWLSLIATRWVRRGFEEAKGTPSVDEEEPLLHHSSKEADPVLHVPDSPSLTQSQGITGGDPPAYLLPLRIVRGVFGFVGGWQFVGLLPALSILGNPNADLGKLAAVALVKVPVGLLCFAIFFGLRSAINKAHFKHCGIPHPALKRTWSL